MGSKGVAVATKIVVVVDGLLSEEDEADLAFLLADALDDFTRNPMRRRADKRRIRLAERLFTLARRPTVERDALTATEVATLEAALDSLVPTGTPMPTAYALIFKKLRALR